MKNRQYSWLFLLVIFLGVLTWKMAILYQIFDNRVSPIEPDDSYGYMTQAAAWDCKFGSHCPGLDELRKDLLTPTDDKFAKYHRFRQFSRFVYSYYPLYSLTLRAGRALSQSWDASFNLITFAGAILLHVGIAWLLVALFGPVPAGVGLLISMPFWMGFVFATPWMFALAFGAMAMAVILQKRDRWFWFWLLSVIAMLFHPYGRLTFAAGAFFYFIQFRSISKRELWQFLFGSVAVFAFIVVVDRSISIPIGQGVNPAHQLDLQGLLAGIRENGTLLLQMLYAWVNKFGGGFNVLWLVLGAFALLDSSWRRRSVLIVSIIFLTLICSTLMVMPDYPGTLGQRVGLPISMILSGLLGLAVWQAGKHLWGVVAYFQGRVQMASWVTVFAAAFFVAGAVQSIPFFLSHVPGVTEFLVRGRSQRHDYLFSLKQVDNFKQLANERDQMMFLNEDAFYYYSIQTDFRYRFIHANSLDDVMQAGYAKSGTWPPKFVSSWNPLRNGRIIMEPGGEFLLRGAGGMPFADGVWLKVAKWDSASELSVTTDTGVTCQVTVTQTGRWQQIPCAAAATKELRIAKGAEGDSSISIVGVRIGDGSLNWPWNRNIELFPDASNLMEPILFNMSDIGHIRFSCPLQVINDYGTFILSTRRCPGDTVN